MLKLDLAENFPAPAFYPVSQGGGPIEDRAHAATYGGQIRYAVWTVDGMHDLFDSTTGRFKPDELKVRGPHPDCRRKPTVRQRRECVAGVISELNVDVFMIVNGAALASSLQLFFDEHVGGDWVCDVRRTHRGCAMVGVAVRMDNGKFSRQDTDADSCMDRILEKVDNSSFWVAQARTITELPDGQKISKKYPFASNYYPVTLDFSA